MFTFVFLISAAAFGVGSMEEFTKEDLMRVEGYWTRGFCKNQNKNLIDDLQECSKTEAQQYQDVYYACIEETGLKTRSFFEYIKAACADETIASTYLKCIERSADDPKFLEDIKDHAETEKCYEGVWPKYEMEPIKELYFKKQE